MTGLARRFRRLAPAGAGFLSIVMGASTVWGGAMGVARAIDWAYFLPIDSDVRDLWSPVPITAASALESLERREEAKRLPEKYREELVQFALADQAAPTTGPNTQALMNYLGGRLLAHDLGAADASRFLRQCVRLSLEVRHKAVAGKWVSYWIKIETRGPKTPPSVDSTVWELQVGGWPALIDGTSNKDRGGVFGLAIGGVSIGQPFLEKAFATCSSAGRHVLTCKVQIRILYLGVGLTHGMALNVRTPDSDAADPNEGQLLWKEERIFSAPVIVFADDGPDVFKLIDQPGSEAAMRKCITPHDLECNGNSHGTVEGHLQLKKLPYNIAFDVIARYGGKEHPLRSITARTMEDTDLHFWGSELFELPCQPTVDIILRSSREVAEDTPDLYAIWKGEIVYLNVPIEGWHEQ
jgi:hypothetical protein